MPPEREPGTYSRLYHRFRDEYPEVYYDDLLLATWCRLLVGAEAAYPEPAEVPRHVDSAALDRLVVLGLVEVKLGDRYTVLGLVAERARRAIAGRIGGLASGAARRPDTNDRSTIAERSVNERRTSKSKSKSNNDVLPPDGANTSPSSSRRVSDETLLESGGPRATEVEDRHQGGADPDVLRLQKLAEELTGVPYSMPNVYSGLGAKAVEEQLRPYGLERVSAAWTTVAERVRAKGGNVTIRQLVLGADNVLNPVPGHETDEERDATARRAFDRRVERTRRANAELRGGS